MTAHIEIERKYLLMPTCKWAVIKHCDEYPLTVRQGYILTGDPELRVRMMKGHVMGQPEWVSYFMTSKSGSGISREETEIDIDYDMYVMLMKTAGKKIIEKRRFRFGRWEVDVFEGRHEGFIMAEIELTSPDEEIEFPEWMKMYVMDEVTDDPKYKNKALAGI